MTAPRNQTLRSITASHSVLPMDAKPPRMRRIEPMERPTWLQRLTGQT